MVTTANFFEDETGLVYLIPYEGEELILAQVGFGGDIGIFNLLVKAKDDIKDLSPPLLFRVHYGRLSPKKWKWVEAGMLPYMDALATPCPYAHNAVGSDEYAVVIHGHEDRLVDAHQAEQYEPLATWSHEHIVRRFRRERMGSGNSG